MTSVIVSLLLSLLSPSSSFSSPSLPLSTHFLYVSIPLSLLFVVMVIVSSPQININLPFILQLQRLVLSSLSPLDKLKKIEPVEEVGPKTLNPLEERQRFLQSRYSEPGPELVVTLSLNSPQVLLLEDATNNDTRLLLLEVCKAVCMITAQNVSTVI